MQIASIFADFPNMHLCTLVISSRGGGPMSKMTRREAFWNLLTAVTSAVIIAAYHRSFI